jgi:AcrR family transcriptional regulator
MNELGDGASADGTAIRRRILEAALDLVTTEGVAALTQPRVARLAGVRQSHLTYYFPRKSDLFLALFEASHARAAADADDGANPLSFLAALMFDRDRARFFVRTILEVGDDAAARSVVATHARGLAGVIAPHFGRTADDPAILCFIDLLRGWMLRRLLEPEAPAPDLEAVAAILGLRPARP